MKNLDDFRRMMKNALQEEKSNRSIVLVGKSLEEILAQASIELSLPLHKLDYEIQLKGSKGLVFGTFGQKNWRVMVYPARKHLDVSRKKSIVSAEGVLNADQVEVESVDGKFGFHLNKNGEVMLKIVPSVGTGKDVEMDDILHRAGQTRSIPPLDETIVRRVLLESQGVWVKVAEYPHNVSADASFSVSMSEDEMKATITITTPALGGATPSYEEMKSALHQAGVFAGIKEDVLADLEMNPIYRTAVIVAQGVPAQSGEDSRIQCLHDLDSLDHRQMQTDAKGAIDFKRITMIHSVAEGEVVARVLQPTDGVPGVTVRGSMIAAKNGERKAIILKGNVKLSDDETEVVATANGQVVMKDGAISVENIYTVEGDLKSHIDFLGTVVINGNIEDGYEVKAEGDITVTGSVGRSQLTAGGNIIVGNGINGNKYGDGAQGESQSFVKAGKNLWASFIQNCYVEANQMVVVSDGILNSNITSMGKVLCKGKRATIVGGRIRAFDEINAVVFGSNSGTTTKLEVGVNPKLKDRLKEVELETEKKSDSLTDLRRIIDNWSEASRNHTLAPDKKKKYDEMIAQAEQMARDIQENREKMQEIKEQLSQRHTDAKIAASMKIHSGVEIIISEYEYVVSSEFSKGQTFYLDMDQIKIKDYEEITDDITPEVDNKKKKRYTKNSVALV